MGDATLRRWYMAAHFAFSESHTILAAVSLIGHAFELVSDNAKRVGLDEGGVTAIVRRCARALHEGAEGQAIDLSLRRVQPSPDKLELCYRLKTGAMLALPVTLGARLAKAPAPAVTALEESGYELGIAFQMVDDLLDFDGAAESGKDLPDSTVPTIRAAAQILMMTCPTEQ